MTTSDHTTIEELLAVRALGGLDGTDDQLLEREMAAHGDCERCRTLDRRFSDVAGRLGLSLDPVAVDPAMADRILAEPRPQAPTAVEPSAGELVERRTRRGRRLAAALTMAAALALVVGGTIFLEGTTTKLGTVTSSQQIVQFTTAPDAQGTLNVAFSPGQTGAVLWGTDMADPGAGKVYEVWMIADGQAPVSGGCLSPTDGRVSTAVPGANLNGVAQMAVTVESDSCPGAPTTTPIMTAQLTA
jgi:anti-sigma-K factor RskA